MESHFQMLGGFPPNWQGGHELGNLQHSHGPHGQTFRPMGVSRMQLMKEMKLRDQGGIVSLTFQEVANPAYNWEVKL